MMAQLAPQRIARPSARKVLLVTERPLLLAGFRELLDHAGLGVEHSVLRSTGLPAALEKLGPCLAVIDADSRVEWDLLADLRRNTLQALFVVWCHQVTPEVARLACEAGVHGLLSSRLPLEEAAATLLEICQGQQKFRFEATQDARNHSPAHLSRREQEVLALVKHGLKNREIASALRTTQGSVKVYLNRLFRKTGVRNRYELALVARRSSPEILESAASAAFDESWMFAAQ